MRWLVSLIMVAAIGIGFASPCQAQSQSRREHRLAVHVDDSDPAKMNLALNNISNVVQYYSEKGEPVSVELVAYGPGLNMLRTDKSPVLERIKSFTQSMPDVTFSACGNTMDNMKKAESLAEIPLAPGVTVVPAGVVRLMELQEQGWSYIRP